jgi:ribosomal protein S18 acetylase RimI-like enzyme
MKVPPSFIAKRLSDPPREPTEEELAEEKKALEEGDNYGHVDTGKTIAVHQMAIHKDYHRKGLGKILLKEFMQRMKQSGIAKRLVLIARDQNVKFYEKVGFDERGGSNTKIAGGGWKNMYGYM